MSDASTGDSQELEALFDSIAGGLPATPAPAPQPAAQPAPQPAPAAARPSLMQQARESSGTVEDTDDLQALFDSIVDNKTSAPEAAADGGEAGDGQWPKQGAVFNQVGQMARQLHDTLGALGYDKLIEQTVSAIPDTRDRLAYIANLTEQAACKVLNATDVANPLQDELEAGAALLAAKWDALYANQLSIDEFKLLAAETRAYLKTGVPQRTGATKAQLLEIMMAQDFQDLTGQVIKKIVTLAQDFESQLMKLLIETMPGEKRTDEVDSLLNGPVINAAGRTDIVGNQQQVDDLLETLGF